MVDQRGTVLAVNCSPSLGGKTLAAIDAVLAGAAESGATTSVMELGAGRPVAEVVEAMRAADAFVFGSPMYRGTYTAQFKDLMDHTPRGMYGESDAPISARAVLTVATAASDHHLLGPGSMRDVLVDFFAAHVVSPGLYLTGAAYVDGALTPENDERARLMGRALVELARAIDSSTALRAVTPNA
ncbi:MAG: NAD(P)H-dependent oxidoreductase [Nocardioides sp.]|uniref:flavodoxin family protein n=1 Tax=Nocardioides sp. TaxID=35761 RepID=UPI0039E38A06